MKLHRSGQLWIVPMITIRQSTIPGRYIVAQNFGDRNKVKVYGIDAARSKAHLWQLALDKLFTGAKRLVERQHEREAKFKDT